MAFGVDEYKPWQSVFQDLKKNKKKQNKCDDVWNRVVIVTIIVND